MNEKDAVLKEKSLDRWLDEREVSCLTRLSLSTLRAHRFYGKGIPYSKVGRSVRYSLADVTTFMAKIAGTVKTADITKKLDCSDRKARNLTKSLEECGLLEPDGNSGSQQGYRIKN